MTQPKNKYYPALPESISLGYQDIQITMTDFLEGQGVYLADRAEIRVKEGDSNRELLNTILHESLHAAMYVYGMHKHIDDDKNEYICNTLGNALTELLTRNPKLAEWICAAAKE